MNLPVPVVAVGAALHLYDDDRDEPRRVHQLSVHVLRLPDARRVLLGPVPLTQARTQLRDKSVRRAHAFQRLFIQR